MHQEEFSYFRANVNKRTHFLPLGRITGVGTLTGEPPEVEPDVVAVAKKLTVKFCW